MRKVFGIGFHKTGTSSLRSALEFLGYRVTGPDWTRDPAIEQRVAREAISRAGDFDAFQDNPWPLLYREMDHAFPDSLFVLTLRPMDSWLNSCIQHFGKRSTPMREWIYGAGSPVGNEDVYVRRHMRHITSVRDYFSNAPEKLLEFRISEGEGWGPLCGFLGHPLPEIDFPHKNAASDRLKPQG